MKLPLKKQLGFTLIEQIIALGVFMLCLMLLMTSMQLIKKTDEYLRIPDGLEWHLAMVQLHDATVGSHFEESKNVLYGHNPDKLIKSKHNKLESYSTISLKISGTRKFYYSKNGGFISLIDHYNSFSLQRQGDCMYLTCEMPWEHQFEYPFTPATHGVQLEQTITKTKTYLIKRQLAKEVKEFSVGVDEVENGGD